MKRTRRSTVCLVFLVLLAGLWLVDAVEAVGSLPFDVFGWAGETVDRLSPKTETRKDKDDKGRKDKKDAKDLKDRTTDRGRV